MSASFPCGPAYLVDTNLQPGSCFSELFARVTATMSSRHEETNEMSANGAATEQPPKAVEEGNRWLALYVLCAGTLMIVLDITIVNVALPSIQNDLRFSQSNLAWVVNAYLVPFGGLLLLAACLPPLDRQTACVPQRSR